MATTQISKIQLRRGESFDLPGRPSSLSPLTFTPGLDTGELGFTTDTGRLFIGQNSPTGGQINFNRIDFPYRNIEVLTESSPPNLLQVPLKDNRYGFIRSAPMANTGVWTTFQIFDPRDPLGLPYQDFYLDLSGQGACAMMTYFIFDDTTKKPLRLGQLGVIWNGISDPSITPVETVPGNNSDIEWTAVVASDHVVLQYQNRSGGTVTTWFHIDRPSIG